MVSPAFEFDTLELQGAASYRVSQEHFPTRRDRGDACGKVDRGAEPVAVSGDGRAVMHPDANGGEAMTGHHVVGRREAQEHRFGGVPVPDHDRITDRLDHLAAAGARDPRDLAAEGGGELGGVGVAMRLGERGVTRNVGEDKGPAVMRASGHATTVLRLRRAALRGCAAAAAHSGSHNLP
jgi:hypothetical protein